MANNNFQIAVIPGDGIGTEVIPEGLRVLEVASRRFNLGFDFKDHDFASANYYKKHGQMMPDNWQTLL